MTLELFNDTDDPAQSDGVSVNASDGAITKGVPHTQMDRRARWPALLAPKAGPVPKGGGCQGRPQVASAVIDRDDAQEVSYVIVDRRLGGQ